MSDRSLQSIAIFYTLGCIVIATFLTEMGQAFHRIKQRASARSTAAPCLPTLRHSPP